MTFAIAGSVVTQTGTDTNLTGLVGLAGVLTQENGGTGQDSRTVYDLSTNNLTLVVNGTLSFDPRNEELWLPGVTNAISGTGTLTIGGSDVLNSVTVYRAEQALFFKALSSQHAIASAFVNAGNTLSTNLNGGVITCRGPFGFRNGTINRLFLRTGTNVAGTGTPFEVLFDTVTGNSINIEGRAILIVHSAGNTFNSFNLVHTDGLFAAGSATTASETLTTRNPIFNYSATGQNADLRFWRGGKMRIRNSSLGSNMVAIGHIDANFNATGLYEIQQDLTITIRNTAGAAISGGLYWIRDYNNGNRQNAGYVGGTATANAAVNLTADKTYTGTFDVSGVAGPVTITTAYANRTANDGSNVQGTYDTGPNRYDRRTKTDVPAGVNLDQMDVFIWQYLYNPVTLTPSLIGVGGTSVSATMLTDTSITETNQTTVDAYTVIDTLARLYDRAKSYKINSANVEYPTSSTQLINAGGATVTTNVTNFVVDSGAASVFAVNTGTNTLTIRPTTLSAGGAFNTLNIPATRTFTLSGSSTLLTNLELGGTATVPGLSRLSGTLTILSTGVLNVTALSGLVIPTGSAAAGGKITIAAANPNTVFDGRNFNFNASSIFENTSGHPIVLKIDPTDTAPTLLPTSGTITVDNTVSIIVSAPNLLNLSRVRLYNNTTATEINNSTAGVSGYSFTLVSGTHYTPGDNITLLATYSNGGVAKQVFRATATTGTTDITFSDSQINWSEYNALGINGATVSECSTDFVNIEVDVTNPNDATEKARIAAFIVHALSTADGIRNWVTLGGTAVIRFENEANATIDTTVVALTIKNEKAASKLRIEDAFSLKWADGVQRIDAVLGSSIIWSNPSEVFVEGIPDIAPDVWGYPLDGTVTSGGMMRVFGAVLAGKVSGAGSGTEVFRAIDDSKVRLTSTVDNDGNRTAISIDSV